MRSNKIALQRLFQQDVGKDKQTIQFYFLNFQIDHTQSSNIGETGEWGKMNLFLIMWSSR